MTMTKTRWIAGAAIAAMLTTGYAQAMPGRGGAGAPPSTRAELQARIAEQFRKADTNADGAVTKAEIEAAREERKAESAQRRAERREQRFAALDANKDGQLSKAEFTAQRARGDGKGRDGNRATGNKDGAAGKHVGHRGWRGHHRMGGMAMHGAWFDRADADKNGKVTLAEAQAGPLAMFDKMDSNRDGTISQQEHEAARAAMRAKWQEKRSAAAKN